MFMIIDIWDKLEMWFRPNSKTREWFYVMSSLGETNLVSEQKMRHKKNSSMLWLLFSPYSIICLVENLAWRFVCWTSLFYYCKLEGASKLVAKCSSVEVHSFFQQHRYGKCIKCCRSHENISFFVRVAYTATHKMVWNVPKWHQILVHVWIHSEGNYKIG